MKNKKSLLLIALSIAGVGALGLSNLSFAADLTTGTKTSIECPMGYNGKHEPGIMGKITSISGTTITLTGKQPPQRDSTATSTATAAEDITYTVDANAATIKKFAAGSSTDTKPAVTTITVSGLAVGDTIMVRGTVTGTSVVATEIMSGRPTKGPANHERMNGKARVTTESATVTK